MKSRNNQAGFSIVELGLVVVLIAIIGFVAYRFYDSQANQQTTEQSSTSNDVKPAPEINDSDDLNTAETTLDQTDPGSSTADTNQLNGEVSTF